MIIVKDLIKRYKEIVALDNFNLRVEDGEIYGLLGPNGSGKTTAISSIISIIPYDSGEIYLFGEKMSPNKFEIKKNIGYVPQELAFMNELTVYENIDFFAGLYIYDKNERKKLVEEAIDFCGLENFRKFRPNKLSGGLKRRLNIACGICHRPKLIFFDEPTVAVDPQSRNKILEGIKELNSNGSTIVYTSHYMEEVEYLCNRLTIIDKGRNLITGTKKQITEKTSLKDKLIINEINIDREKVDKIKKLSYIDSITYEDKTLCISLGSDMAIGTIITFLKENNIYYEDLNIKQANLNDVFLEVTGKELRDNV